MTLLVLSLLLLAPPAKRPYTIQDQVALKRLGKFAVSHDASRIVFELRTTDLEANRGRYDLWLINTDGSNLKQLTSNPENDTGPVWSADDKALFFLSSRTGTDQVFRLALDGGEPVQITSSPLDVGSFTLSPDGQQLAFSASVFVDCETKETKNALDCTKKKLDDQAKNKASGKVYDTLLFRHWDAFSDGRRNHLFVQKAMATGSPLDVMKKMNADAPTKPFGDAAEYTFTPDSKALVFTARDVGREEAWSTDLDLFTAMLDGSKAPVKVTTVNRATDTQPVFSPDGKSLAYLAMSKPGYEADKLSVIVRTLASGKETNISAKFDRSASSIVWSADSKTVYVDTDDLGHHAVFALDVGTGDAVKILGQGHAGSIALAGTQLVVALDSLKSPADLYTLSLDGAGTLKPLTTLNQEAMSRVKLGEPEQFSFAGANGDTVYAWVVKPVDFSPQKKYPLAFLIHGGPQGSLGNEWHYRWNPQIYAAHGYVAVMVDFHGSTGYGQAFTDAIGGDWGGKPLEDLQKGLSAALQKYPFIDQKHMCALGSSYGGFMVNYIAGVWNEPWKCLVSHDGNLDEVTAYYDTEELWFPEREHGGLPWEKGTTYGTHNPIDHVSKWRVPMMIIHGGKDFRVVETQGFSSFTALQRRNVPSKLLYFPDENHWVLKPANSVLWHESVLGWLDQWSH